MVPQGQGSPGNLARHLSAWCGKARAPPLSPAHNLLLRGIITFGEVKGSSPHPAWPHGPGTEWEGKLPTLNPAAPLTRILEWRAPVPLNMQHRHTHTHSCWSSLCQGFYMSSLHTDWLILRAGPSPLINNVPWGRGQRAQQVSLPDWPTVGPALGQLHS